MPGFVEADGPGVVGPLAAGWSASFSAMPHSPLYESGTTGQISFSAPSTPDTAFLMFNRAVFQYFAPDFWDELGVPTMLPVNDTTNPSDGGGGPNDGGGDPNDPNGWGNVPWGSSPWGGGTNPSNPGIQDGWGSGTWGGGTWGGGAPPPKIAATPALTGSGGLLLTTSAIDGGVQIAATQVGLTGAGGLTALGGTPAASVRVPLAGTGGLGTNQNRRAFATVKLSGGSGLSATGSATITPTASIPAWDHVVVVIMENKASTSVISNGGYMTNLANANAYMTNSFAITHPSLPNYLALWSGSTQGVTDDGHYDYAATVNHLGAQMAAKGITFKAYSEDLPSVGYLGDTSGNYARKHAPWVSWQQNGGFSGAQHVPFTQFPTDFTALPKLSFVIPNLIDDVHDAGISTGNTWLQAHIDPYVQWAKTHNSLLILTFDEDDGSSSNHIYTAFAGALVRSGQYTDTINHYSVLGLIQDWLGLPRIGASAGKAPIVSPWPVSTPHLLTESGSILTTESGSQLTA